MSPSDRSFQNAAIEHHNFEDLSKFSLFLPIQLRILAKRQREFSAQARAEAVQHPTAA